jgi:hypothetical protein
MNPEEIPTGVKLQGTIPLNTYTGLEKIEMYSSEEEYPSQSKENKKQHYLSLLSYSSQLHSSSLVSGSAVANQESPLHLATLPVQNEYSCSLQRYLGFLPKRELHLDKYELLLDLRRYTPILENHVPKPQMYHSPEREYLYFQVLFL